MRYTTIPTTSRDEWLELRKTRVTATDIPKIISGTEKAYRSLWSEKRGDRRFGGNRYTKFGKQQEPVIAAQVSEWFPELAPNDQLLVSVDDERFAATPDMIGQSMIGEIKTAKSPWGFIEDLPRHYFLQVQWQLLVTGAESCLVAWQGTTEVGGELRPDGDIRTGFVYPDEATFEQMRRVATEFLEFTPQEARDLSGDFYASHLLSEVLEIDRQIGKNNAANRRLQDERAGLVAEFLRQFGDEAQVVECGDLVAEVSGPKVTNRFDRKGLAREYPDLERKYVLQETKPSTVKVKSNG
ncbi:YqaJ viral recombinase family protein [Corynebacterium heidelbergense]|uniref:YqaJ viral recombinase domain-containing protein n=1 Tax=Corynebacterium heidelbergense TaxID=2055947 RepID=A0A364VE36_9CORY|nr:YqaJ viral recombinase family protein [Corynebacterium heidelbergense]RAV34881.1 hypothetical protein CWC39_00650 [Corynebacterium heidelbergense]WCZ36017.1 YqaJ-like viral recombinase domain protein [Corynebacterium heidelbergense]